MNFDFLKEAPELEALFERCNKAEQLAVPFPDMSCAAARTALEYIVALVYKSVVRQDASSQTLFERVTDPAFVEYINDETIISAIHTVRINGNCGAHGNAVTPAVACKTLEQLQYVVGEICMNLKVIKDYPVFVSPLKKAAKTPNKSCGGQGASDIKQTSSNAPMPKTAAPKQPEPSITPTEEVVSHFAPTLRRTRFNVFRRRNEEENKRLFVEASLREAHWLIANSDNQAYPSTASINMTLGDGSTIDYVLYGKDGRPLAVIDFTHSGSSPIEGRAAAQHAAEVLKQQYGYTPTAYYVFGYHIFCLDCLGFPVRRVFGFHSLDELELLKQRAASRKPILHPNISDEITNREYQKKAISAVCQAFSNNRRRSLVVMATGTGKTRVAISTVDVLMQAGWVKNVLFLADRTSLARQAHKNFNKLLPNITTSIFTGTSDGRDKNARIIFATYQTMIRLVDGDTREFGIGRFDLIVVDEAHRSLFSKYGRLFHYFDALMIGLTATPRSDQDKSTYDVFQLPSGEPDFAYELEEAIQDKYLVGFEVCDRTTEALRRGINYDDLSDEEKAAVEEEFGEDLDTALTASDETRNIVIKPGSNIINVRTIDLMLADLMQEGLKINANDTLGKTIIFAKNHREAEIITNRFQALYPNLGTDFCKLIDSQVEDALRLVDVFGERGKMPQIAVSVDMLDTGIDVPDILNLVFFKTVRSKIKFLQMVGRGTRLSEGIFGPDGDKQGFLAFDYFDNFRYFGARDTWSTVMGSGNVGKTSSQNLLRDKLRLEMLVQLQEKKTPTTFEVKYRDALKQYFEVGVSSLNNDAIEVDRNIAFVNKYRTEGAWNRLNEDNVAEIEGRILPLFSHSPEPAKVKSFDILMLTVEVKCDEYLESGKDPRAIKHGFKRAGDDFTCRMEALLKLKSIPAIQKKEKLLIDMMDGSYLFDCYSLERAEYVRNELRDLMQYIPDRQEYYVVDLPDVLIKGEEVYGLQGKTYADRYEEYLRDDDNIALSKLRSLEPLTEDEKKELKDTFTKRLGSEAEYAAWSNNAPLFAFLRKKTGISDEAIKAKLGHILNAPELNDEQRAFMRQVVDYACANGDVEARTLLNESPFNNYDLNALFGDRFPMLKELLDSLHKPVVG
ncbi:MULTISPECIES: type I restriction endonuclease subunit R [Enorma]|uniref:type I restriction endonuclease subunit R n=1 Tax=Enorma TaxID=1472762 RepID=UPI000347296A|nr:MULTISPECIES: DEAD/DEAH box helicase family protein [Enorma]